MYPTKFDLRRLGDFAATALLLREHLRISVNKLPAADATLFRKIWCEQLVESLMNEGLNKTEAMGHFQERCGSSKEFTKMLNYFNATWKDMGSPSSPYPEDDEDVPVPSSPCRQPCTPFTPCPCTPYPSTENKDEDPASRPFKDNSWWIWWDYDLELALLRLDVTLPIVGPTLITLRLDLPTLEKLQLEIDAIHTTPPQERPFAENTWWLWWEKEFETAIFRLDATLPEPVNQEQIPIYLDKSALHHLKKRVTDIVANVDDTRPVKRCRTQ